jgi:hypothetical protein
MKSQAEKEKLVKDLVNTFNDRDVLHAAYKEKMKHIITYAIIEFVNMINEKEEEITDECIAKFINNFVEEKFKPE